MPTQMRGGNWCNPAVLAAVASLLVALLGSLAGPASAVEAQGLRVDPVEADVLGPGQVLRPALPPGGSVTYPLQLRNTRDTDVEALVYGADVTDGQVVAGTDNTGVGSWVSLEADRIELAAGATTVVDVTLTRPLDDTDGGTAAVVVQLGDDSREALGLDRIERAALRIEVAADGTGEGTPVEIVRTNATDGFLPDTLTVELQVTNPGTEPAIPDVAVVLTRRLGDDARIGAEVGTIAPGATVTTTVVVDVPWSGLFARARAEAAAVGLTSVSPTVGVTVIPPWVVLLLVLTALAATVRARRALRDGPFELGRVPDHEPANDA